MPRVRSEEFVRWRRELAGTLRLALPIIGTQLAQVAINLTDILMMGWLGPDSLAAGALGVNLYFITFVAALGLVLAVAPLLAHAIGARRRVLREIQDVVRHGLALAAVAGVVCMAVLWHSEAILLLFGQDARLAADAAIYQGAMLWGIVPALGFVVLRQFVAARSRPRSAFVVQLVVLAANALGNYALMFGTLGLPALGLLGAGIASAGANILGFVLMVAVIESDRDFRRHRLFSHLARLNIARLVVMLRLGLPIAGLFCFEVTLWCGAVYAMGWIGVAELAAHQIAIQCASLTFMVPLGIGQAATVRVGLHVGAGDRAGARRAGHVALGLSFAFMSATALAFILGGGFIARLFLDVAREDAAHAAAIAATLLAIAGVFQVLDGAQAVALGALRGLKDTTIPMLFAALGYWAIGFPACLIFGFTLALGAPGIWYGLSLGLGIVALLACWRFERLSRP